MIRLWPFTSAPAGYRDIFRSRKRQPAWLVELPVELAADFAKVAAGFWWFVPVEWREGVMVGISEG